MFLLYGFIKKITIGGDSLLVIKQDILPKGHKNRPALSMKPLGLLFHTTNNWKDGSGDEMHSQYMKTVKDRVVSWHVTVDKDSATQHIPFNENAWHAGDGYDGHYNRNWIGLEIACEAVNMGEPLDKATYNNAVDVAAQIMMMHNWETEDKLQPHAIVYGKDCPHHTLFDRKQFIRDVLNLIKKRKEEEKLIEELKKQIQNLENRIQYLELIHRMNVPDWAKEAIDAFTSMKDKNGKAIIDTPNGGSSDFYRFMVVLHRIMESKKGDE